MKQEAKRRPFRESRVWSRLRLMGWTVVVWAMAGMVWAGGGKPATKIYNVADSRAMDGGLSKWIADVYNAGLWQYAALVVVTMATMGLVLGLGMDRLIGLLGINLGKLDHEE